MNVAILRSLVAIGATIILSSAVSAGECLNYEPAIVSIQGRVSLKPAYGPPGYGEDPKHDAHEDYLALTFDAPVCVTASSKPHSEDVGETDIKTMQLAFPTAKAFQDAKQWIGKHTSVNGSLYHAFSGHHHTLVLMTVQEIAESPKP